MPFVPNKNVKPLLSQDSSFVPNNKPAANPAEEAPEGSGIFSTIAKNYSTRAGNIFNIIKEKGGELLNPNGRLSSDILKSAKTQVAGEAAGFVNDEASDLFSRATKRINKASGGRIGDTLTATGENIAKTYKDMAVAIDAATGGKLSETMKATGGNIAKSPLGDFSYEAFKNGTGAFEILNKTNPDMVKDMKSYAAIVQAAGTLNLASNVASGVADISKKAVSGLGDAAAKTAQGIYDIGSDAATGVSNLAKSPTAERLSAVVADKVDDVSAFAGRASNKLAQNADDAVALAAKPSEYKAVVKLGVPENTVKRLAQATKGELDLADDAVKAIKDNLSNNVSEANPKAVFGQHAVDKILVPFEESIKETGKKIGNVKLAIKGIKTDPSSLLSEWADDVAKAGLEVSDDGALVAQNGFTVSPDTEDVLRTVKNAIGDGSPIDLARLDSLREGLFTDKNGVAFRNQAVALVDKYRKLALDKIVSEGANSTNANLAEFAKLSKEYAIRKNALRNFVKYVDPKVYNVAEIDPLAVGEKFARTQGNASAAPRKIFNQLMEAAKEAGITSDVNPTAIGNLVDELVTLTGTKQSGSLVGGIETALGNSSLLGTAKKGVEAAFRLAKPEALDQINAIEKLIQSLRAAAK